MSSSLFFDAFAFDDVNGTSLGELTQAYDKEYRAVDNAPGSGQFTINRHDSQYVDHLCHVDNLIRVRRVAGGPFDYDDARYIGAFWIEEGSDELVSPDEEGGEEITRGGRSAEACLRWAILYPDAFYGNNEKYTTKTRKNGNWVIDERTAGEVLAIFLRDVEARSPNPLPFVDRDFGVLQDSTNEDWSDTDTKWRIPVGTDGLSLLGTCVSGDLFYRMGADMVMHAYEEDPGQDLSSSITITKGTDLSEAATRDIHARNTISRALVRGTTEDGDIKYREVVNTDVEDAVGRREGFVEYKRTPTNNKLNKAGRKYIRRMKRRHDGPTTVGIVELAGQVAFDDFVPGDILGLNVPGEFASVDVRVAAIQLTEREGGDTDVILEFEDTPFDPAHNEAEFGDGSDGGNPGGNGGNGCGDCPPLPPHTGPPGEECEYPDCADPWPYEGVVSGLSDGHDDGCVADTHMCFEPDTEYAYELSGSSADPGAYAWAFNITVNCDGGMTFRVCSLAAPDGPAWGPITGTFMTDGTIIPAHGYIAWGSHADSTHFAGGRPFTINFRVWPVEGTTCDPANVPAEGQQHTEEFTGDGAEDTFQTAYPYAPGSLHVTVNGVAVTVTETDPTTGELTFVDAPPIDAIILVTYQNAGTVPTGGPGTTPTPSPTPSGGSIAELDDIPDVNAPSPADGDVLTWDSTPGEWIAAPPAAGVDELEELTDVDLTSPAVGDRLRFNGSLWVNSRLAWAPVMVNAPNLVTTDGTAVYVPLVTTGGDPVLVETLT